MRAIILAAGIGSRLGKPHPKPLTRLASGETILERQIDRLTRFLTLDDIILVVGYKKDLIMERFPRLTYVYNNFYDTTNTASSLLAGLRKVRNEDVLWLNGDVVFEQEALERILAAKVSAVAVNTDSVGDEEIKYTLNEEGAILDLSKTVKNGLGEAVGINLVRAADLSRLVAGLERCEANDYFERGIEIAAREGLKMFPVYINNLLCMEIDFEEDLKNVNDRL
ncbi:MAG: phosphocholine cytidylyltransferase family protein [FCB group bacterium]|nr:phosphocholine cytidylyltransferase family protein [FCB group bacterium]